MFNSIKKLVENIQVHNTATCTNGAFIGCSIAFDNSASDYVLTDSLGNKTPIKDMGADINMRSTWVINK